MKNLMLFVVAVFSVFAHAQTPPSLLLGASSVAHYQEAENFLMALGYEDFVAQAQKTIEKSDGIHPVSLAALKVVSDYYVQLNAARDLAAFSYAILVDASRLEPQLRSEIQEALIQMAIQQVQPFPLIALEPIFDLKISQPRGEKAAEGRARYLEKRGAERYMIEKRNLLRLLKSTALRASLAPAASIDFEKWLDKKLTQTLTPQYEVGTRQQNHHFGRALVAVFMKYAIQKNDHALAAQLKAQLASVQIDLKQVIGAQYNLGSPDRPELYALKNGDLALEYSVGGQAYTISLGVKPRRVEDLKMADQFELINGYKNLPTYALTKSYSIALEKLKANYVLSEDEERAVRDHWNASLSRGFSHVGMVEVKTDADTKISLAWIWDIFPQGKTGGHVRLMTPEGFAYPERFLRIGFARYGAEKLKQTFQKQIDTRGYLQNVWESYESKTVIDDGESTPVLDRSARVLWTSRISKEQVLDLREKSNRQDSETWYQHEILPRVFAQVRKYVTSEQALVFADGLVNGNAMAYCAQFVNLAYLQAVNFDLQTTPDAYRGVPTFLAKALPKVVTIDLQDRVIAPGGLIWQSDIIENLRQINFTRERTEKQKLATRPENTPAALYTHLLEKLPIVQATPLATELTPMDPYDVDPEDDED